LLLLEAGVLVLLLIGAVNVVNLLLIRASARVKELAVRQALGAGWAHLMIEVVVETTLLTFAGGLVGLAAGAGGIQLVRALGADRLPMGSRITFDPRLAFVGLGAALVMGILLAVPVAWFHLRRHLGNALQSESRGGTSGRGAQILRHGFVVSQVAMAFILLAGAGLLGLSLQRVLAISPGFQSDHVLTGQILLPWAEYSEAGRLNFAETLMGKLDNAPECCLRAWLVMCRSAATPPKAPRQLRVTFFDPANLREDTILMESPATIFARWVFHCGRADS
jgi:hypothetical protein